MLYDVVVVGSGVAGLFAALYAKRSGSNVAVLTKSNPFRSNSAVASGGINAVINVSEYDSILNHISDTVNGADGLINKKNIENMCHEAPEIISELTEMGVNFDSDENGDIRQRPFGGAGANRTCYIADKTGSAIVQTLLQQCRNEGVHILSNHQLLNIVKYKEKLSGVTILRRRDSQVIASALRAGLKLSNMEFVQFHPTTLGSNATLISEAARAEGAYIIDERGERFTKELQTRDKLSREIEIHINRGHKVYLDFRHLSSDVIETKLPSAQKMALNSAGVDIKTELLEIRPAAHYSIGGIWTRGDTSTEIDGVFACGECAVTGVHGANRLGGNSLLEGAYFGRLSGIEASRVAKRSDFLPINYADVEKDLRRIDLIIEGESHYNINSMRKNLGEVLFKDVGVFRSEESLVRAAEYVHYLMEKQYGLHCVNKERSNNVELSSILEFKNALLIAEAMALSALKREESRGVHFRVDFPNKDAKFNSSSYITRVKEDFLDIFFGNTVSNNFWYSVKKYINSIKG